MYVRLLTGTLALAAVVCVPAAIAAQSRFTVRESVLPVDTTLAVPPAAATQTPANQTASGDTGYDEMEVSIYPVLLWIPSFSATTNVPPFPDVPNGPDLPGGSGSTEASFDGAALAGFSIAKDRWRIDADGIWAALGSQRERPLLNVDLDVIYGHASGGVRVYNGLYVTGGIRRVALKYDIQIADRVEHFIRKPGIWDPLVGLAWHSPLGRRWALHLVGETGVGGDADTDVSGTVRADLKVTSHFGFTLGYSALHLKLSDTVGQRTLSVKQTMHGPVLGLGFYF